ncbi:MAG TPA: hypothetical protein VF173_33760 [Thermoanaerobaculia bacterium]|nr:hypothetical protein [Thermoanaerobaculia bacterium]
MDVASKTLETLQLLVRHGVDFIVVGAAAAILEGAPIATLDLDIMPRPSPEDRERLLRALQEIHARYLDPAGRHIVPDAGKLDSLRLHRLVTDLGPLDVLSTIGNGMTYDDLSGETILHDLGEMTVRVLNLAMVIRSKEEANRDKDRAVLPILRRTLQLKEGSST